MTEPGQAVRRDRGVEGPGRSADKDACAWLLAQVRPNQSERARANLARQGYSVFHPIQSVTRRRGAKLVTHTTPLFPGYVFVGVASGMPWHQVNSTFGVTRLTMRTAHLPQAVPARVMAELLSRTDPHGVLLAPTDLARGDRVRVASGPLAGFIAQVEALKPAGRVELLLQMMGQAVRADVATARLERICA